jgi:hypothetical protein
MMDNLIDHASLPDIQRAPLPATYEAAKRAIEQCAHLDECQMWANKAEALASYARQSQDTELRRMADRIQARAIRRCGELLQQIQPAHGANQNISDGADTKVVTRKDAAHDAGLSDRQRVTALRVANVPEPEFEAAVETDNPVTVTKLAKLGTVSQPQPDYLKGRDPDDFRSATLLIGVADYILDRFNAIDIEAAMRGLDCTESARLLPTLSDCIDRLSDARERIGYAIQPK